jgi:hypothetical protein
MLASGTLMPKKRTDSAGEVIAGGKEPTQPDTKCRKDQVCDSEPSQTSIRGSMSPTAAVATGTGKAESVCDGITPGDQFSSKYIATRVQFGFSAQCQSVDS